MINYGKTYSITQPQPLEINEKKVYVSSNIQAEVFTDEAGNETNGYSFDFVEYDKDEYLLLTVSKVAELEDELAATKILLGVE